MLTKKLDCVRIEVGVVVNYLAGREREVRSTDFKCSNAGWDSEAGVYCTLNFEKCPVFYDLGNLLKKSEPK